MTARLWRIHWNGKLNASASATPKTEENLNEKDHRNVFMELFSLSISGICVKKRLQMGFFSVCYLVSLNFIYFFCWYSLIINLFFCLLFVFLSCVNWLSHTTLPKKQIYREELSRATACVVVPNNFQKRGDARRIHGKNASKLQKNKVNSSRFV